MTTPRVLVTGASGILGRELLRRAPGDHEVLGRSRSDLDVADRRQVMAELDRTRPQVVLHSAAMTRVDDCESESDWAYQVNWLGSCHVADAAARVGARVVYVSTDYVFDGRADRPYREYDPVCPRSVYGRSKWLGEEAILKGCPGSLVARTQWVFGHGGPNFVDTMLRLAAEGRPLKVVDDQTGCPTFAGDLADGLWKLVCEDPGGGVYHLSSRGETTWYGLAQETFRQRGLDADLQPCSSDEYPRPAPRPPYGVLDNYRLRLSVGDPMPDWQTALGRYLEALDPDPAGS